MTQAASVAMDTVADLLPGSSAIFSALVPGLPTPVVGCFQVLQEPGSHFIVEGV